MDDAVNLFSDVVGQDKAVAQLRAAAVSPVHAYLLVGPGGSGRRAAARSFAALLLCDEGDEDCRRRVLAEQHPDLVVVEREGASISADQVREIIRLAVRSPIEGRRKVLVLVDFHLVEKQAPKLLKTIEEPPPSTVFVVLADHVPTELVTIASRCVRIDFGPVPTGLVAQTLVDEGAERARGEDVAAASGGRIDRARLLASDPGFVTRRDTWRTVPARLDGSGAAVAVIAAELVDLVSRAAIGALEARQQHEVADLEARIERYGERGSGRRQLEERHKRERKRLRTDELRFGLATLQATYRDTLAGSPAPAPLLRAIEAIDAANATIDHNPNESLLLQSLLVRLSVSSG